LLNPTGVKARPVVPPASLLQLKHTFTLSNSDKTTFDPRVLFVYDWVTMRQSHLFTKTRREDPKDEVSKNAKLLIRAGYIHKEMAGVYALLPLGLRVIKKIENIIRREMNLLTGQEIELTALQNPQTWQKTNRWDDSVVDVWFKTNLNSGGEVGLGVTHEEPLSAIMSEYVQSYRDLPRYVYQFQTKFRNELRAKSGIMRGREFLMKDLYSFNATLEEQDAFYEQVAESYKRIFTEVGIGDITHLTFASGGSFSKFSHEFQTESEAGEDTTYVCRGKKLAINEEVFTDELVAELGGTKEEFEPVKTIEVGNIFKLGTNFSEPFGLSYQDETGNAYPVIMGSYGLGLGRLMGTVVEVLSDDKGIVWPRSIAPFIVHLVALGVSDAVQAQSENLYGLLLDRGLEILFDDREVSAGEKLADSDLLGIPTRVIISDKTIAAGAYEVKDRATGEISSMTEAELLTSLTI
jgi:prolyl-tRNA synthetase